MRVVFDTNTVVSALLFEHGELSWLRAHWRDDVITVLVSRDTVEELIRVLAYPKFRLDKQDIQALLAEYLPFTEPVEVAPLDGSPRCRDADDQVFIDLVIAGEADILVTGDSALLEMDISIPIERPAQYRKRFSEGRAE